MQLLTVFVLIGHFAFVTSDISKLKVATKVFMNWYLPSNGVWIGHQSNPADWGRGNALEAISNYMHFRISENEMNYFWKIVTEVQDKQADDFYQTAKYFDDILWWSLAYTRAFDVANIRGETDRANRFLATAMSINDLVFKDAWTDEYCNGGVFWNRDYEYKNAITNELFIASSARLARLTGEEIFSVRATRTLDWLLASGMLSSNGLFVDGLNATCSPGGGVYTYNQGVILGGLAELNLLSKNESYVVLGERIATAATTLMVDDHGIFKEASCGDGALFKGIFSRYLRYFVDQTQTQLAATFQAFLVSQARSVWDVARDKANNYFGKSWAKPFDYNLHNLQVEVIDLLVAVNNATSETQSRSSQPSSAAAKGVVEEAAEKGRYGTDCSSCGVLVEGECVCDPRFSGLSCEVETSWGDYFSGRQLTLSASVSGRLLCATADGTVTTCLVDQTKTQSLFEVIRVNSTAVRFKTSAGKYLSASASSTTSSQEVIAAIAVTRADLENTPSVVFTPVVATSAYNETENPLRLEYIGLRTYDGHYMRVAAGAVAKVNTASSLEREGLFLTNLAQTCQ